MRCFADDPYDHDGDGKRNVSNIVVVYNHLVRVAAVPSAVSGGPYQIVRAGDVIARTAAYGTGANYVSAHLDLQIYIAYGYQSANWAVQLNPRLMFAATRVRPENEQADYPAPFNHWTLQGRREGVSNASFWVNQNSPAILYDMASYLDANLLPAAAPYRSPNCTNLDATSSAYGLAVNPAATCQLDRNDINVTPTPTP